MTRDEATQKLLADLPGLFTHLDEMGLARSAGDALDMVERGCRLILASDGIRVGEAVAQAVLLLALAREGMLEHDAEKAEAS